MTQQYQQPTTGAQMQGQQTTGQQAGQMAQQPSGQFKGELTGELRVALDDFEEVTAVCEWCVDKMIDQGPQMADCIRACEDLADLADLNAKLIARDSIYGLEGALLFASVAQDALPIIQQQQHSHCQETASVVDRALKSTRNILQRFGQPQLIQESQQVLQRTQQQFQQSYPEGMATGQASPGQGGGQQMGGQTGGQQMSGQTGGQQPASGQSMGQSTGQYKPQTQQSGQYQPQY